MLLKEREHQDRVNYKYDIIVEQYFRSSIMDSIKALKISALVVVLVALVYLIVKIFIYGDSSTKVNYQKFGNSVVRDAKTSTEGTDPRDVAVDGILINIGGNQYQYMKSDMTFKMKNRSDKKAIEKNIRAVRDLILRYTSSIKGGDLETQSGKEEYKKALIDLIYNNFGYEVQAIYFRNFVLAQ